MGQVLTWQGKRRLGVEEGLPLVTDSHASSCPALPPRAPVAQGNSPGGSAPCLLSERAHRGRGGEAGAGESFRFRG